MGLEEFVNPELFQVPRPQGLVLTLEIVNLGVCEVHSDRAIPVNCRDAGRVLPASTPARISNLKVWAKLGADCCNACLCK